MDHRRIRFAPGAIVLSIMVVGSCATAVAATAPLILYDDTTALLTPGWAGTGAASGGTSSITEISTDAYEGTKCLDLKFTIIASGENYAYCAIPINNQAGFSMTPYDSIEFAYKQINTAMTPQIEFAWKNGSLPPDAADYSIPKTTAWKTISVSLKSWKTTYPVQMGSVSALYLKAAGAAGTGEYLIDNVSLVTAGGVSIRMQAASSAPANRPMSVSVNNRTMSFSLKDAGTVTVHDLLGNRLAVLHAEKAAAGLAWTAKSTGTYFVRFEGIGTAGIGETQKITVR